jgi:hypothetical protein
MSVFVMAGTAMGPGDLAGIVRGYLPDARITFEQETGGKAIFGNHLIGNSRLIQEFGVQYRPFRQHPPQITNEVRVGENPPPITG